MHGRKNIILLKVTSHVLFLTYAFGVVVWRQNSALTLIDISTVWQLILLLQYCDYLTEGFLARYFSNCGNGGSAPTPIASFWSFNSTVKQACTGGQNVFRNYCDVDRFQSIRSKQSLPALVIKLIRKRWMIYDSTQYLQIKETFLQAADIEDTGKKFTRNCYLKNAWKINRLAHLVMKLRLMQS